MKTVIYYFTGTGNSLAVAKEIAKELGDCELVPVAPLAGTAGDIIPSAARVGIVCPVYDMGLPVIVAEFAGKLGLAGTRYVFGIVTMGGTGVSALHQLDRIVKKKNRRGLDAGFAVKMPGNFPPLQRPPEGAERDKILAAAGWQVREIATKIRKCEPSPARLFAALLAPVPPHLPVLCPLRPGRRQKLLGLGRLHILRNLREGLPGAQHHHGTGPACLAAPLRVLLRLPPPLPGPGDRSQ